MQLYLDTSALVKLVVQEVESSALRRHLKDSLHDALFTAALAQTELIRAVARQGSDTLVQNAHLVLGELDLVPLSRRLLDVAATMMPPELRTLDAIHLAAAMTAPDLRALVTYDDRLARAAADAGITVVVPR